LKGDDAGFQDLAARFDEIDQAVHAAETGDDPASDERKRCSDPILLMAA